MEYFAARVFYEELKFLKIEKNQEPSLEDNWFNDRLFKGTDITDQESDVLNFVLDMIKYNAASQKHGSDEGSKTKALAKLEAIVKNMNQKCLSVENDKLSEQFEEVWK